MNNLTFASLMPKEVLNADELLQIQGGDTPPTPVNACQTGVCLLGGEEEKARYCNKAICANGL